MSTTPERSEHCRALRANGSPCKGRPLADGLCFAHQANAQANRAKGGQNRSNAARSLKMLPARLRPIADLLTAAIDEVHSGKLAPAQATAMAALAGALVRVVTAGETEERLRALEQVARDAEASA